MARQNRFDILLEMDIFIRERIQWVDQEVISEIKPEKELIEEVAQELANWCFKHLPPQSPCLLMVGPGNNGADALFLAEKLSEQGHSVDLLVDRWPKNQPEGPHGQKVSFEDVQKKNYSYIFDGLFGTGLNQEINANYKDWIDWANQAKGLRWAIDIPSGVNANNGQVLGGAFKAHATLTLAVAKPGLFLLPGRSHCGEIHDLAVPTLNQKFASLSPDLKTLPELNTKFLKPKQQDHKYTRGVATIVLSQLYPGAALMAAHSAQKAGAGYTQVLCPESLLKTCQIQHPDLVFKAYSNSVDLAKQIENSKPGAVVIGPGWPPEDSFLEITYSLDKTYIFDGGYLTPELLNHLKDKKHDNFILTPHEGELARLIGATENKWNQCQKLLENFSGVTIAKGYDTLIMQKDQVGYITDWNSPTLATAGTGDILCGLLAAVSLKCQSPMEAAALAVNIHRHLPLNLEVSASPGTLMENIEKTLQKYS